MQYQNSPFNKRQFSCQKCVENAANYRNTDHDESPLPMLKVVLGIIQNRQALDHHPGQECTCCGTCLPSEDAEPPNNVAEEFLCALWCKLADPMILTASCRSPESGYQHFQTETFEPIPAYIDPISAIDATTAANPTAVPR